jgi:hypothetical protein
MACFSDDADDALAAFDAFNRSHTAIRDCTKSGNTIPDDDDAAAPADAAEDILQQKEKSCEKKNFFFSFFSQIIRRNLKHLRNRRHNNKFF